MDRKEAKNKHVCEQTTHIPIKVITYDILDKKSKVLMLKSWTLMTIYWFFV